VIGLANLAIPILALKCDGLTTRFIGLPATDN
jgi:hypothetical protein